MPSSSGLKSTKSKNQEDAGNKLKIFSCVSELYGASTKKTLHFKKQCTAVNLLNGSPMDLPGQIEKNTQKPSATILGFPAEI
jgi:hypothetical protein